VQSGCGKILLNLSTAFVSCSKDISRGLASGLLDTSLLLEIIHNLLNWHRARDAACSPGAPHLDTLSECLRHIQNTQAGCTFKAKCRTAQYSSSEQKEAKYERMLVCMDRLGEHLF
jgi:hypothetical protein